MAGGTSPRLGLKKQSRKRSIPRHVQHEFIPAKRFVARTLVLGSALPQALFGAPDAPVLGVLLCSVPIGIALIVSGARNLRRLGWLMTTCSLFIGAVKWGPFS